MFINRSLGGIDLGLVRGAWSFKSSSPVSHAKINMGGTMGSSIGRNDWHEINALSKSNENLRTHLGHQLSSLNDFQIQLLFVIMQVTQ